jgi:DNA gyrase inhibitor GyrI
MFIEIGAHFSSEVKSPIIPGGNYSVVVMQRRSCSLLTTFT